MLQELMESAVDYNDIETELEQHGNRLGAILEQLAVISEGEEADTMQGWFTLNKNLDVVIKQMEAAKRGLSIVSKLTPGEDRAKHASRVMTNMNKIRGNMRRIENSISALSQPAEEAPIV